MMHSRWGDLIGPTRCHVESEHTAGRCGEWYNSWMTKRLEEVVGDVRELPAEEQDRVADALLTFLSELHDDTWRVA
jgi:hypothetical protein